MADTFMSAEFHEIYLLRCNGSSFPFYFWVWIVGMYILILLVWQGFFCNCIKFPLETCFFDLYVWNSKVTLVYHSDRLYAQRKLISAKSVQYSTMDCFQLNLDTLLSRISIDLSLLPLKNGAVLRGNLKQKVHCGSPVIHAVQDVF